MRPLRKHEPTLTIANGTQIYELRGQLQYGHPGKLWAFVKISLPCACPGQTAGVKSSGMDHPHFTAEFEFKASRKMLFPYINTPSGLAQWFADDVTVDEDKIYTFSWNEEQEQARLVAQRLNKFVRFEFLEDEAGESLIEMRLEENDLTGTVFLSISDSVSASDEEEFRALWNQMADSLREIVGG